MRAPHALAPTLMCSSWRRRARAPALKMCGIEAIFNAVTAILNRDLCWQCSCLTLSWGTRARNELLRRRADVAPDLQLQRRRPQVIESVVRVAIDHPFGESCACIDVETVNTAHVLV